ncbi:hypothetical protein NEFER03_1464 [Nematocida sp. LUAm3]|nr:hypothetical protein NEFER03_1464 [Nematocida sp. LUAm3]KAI5174706.1 hypothetical protein NEFER02_0816 [Nematocida sp. LUAm2]KAI5177883.1 hypothetical protein NEFER01_1085 [Nematocida sp. LUAm1]
MEKVKAFLRIKGEEEQKTFSFTEESILDGKTLYEFDKVFRGEGQEKIYKEVSSAVKQALSGCNLTVFAYGQTGSGKTYTMEGTEKKPGIIPQAIEEIFQADVDKVSLSVVEIYNEKVIDLITPENPVSIREDKASVIVENLTQVECVSKEDALSLFYAGATRRRIESNGINKLSSRSHMLCTISLSMLSNGCHISSKIILVDLAGSERIDLEESESVKRPKIEEKNRETGSINKSLFYLSRIIHTLSVSTQKPKHINYRDSKLTFLLRDSLTGLSKLVIIGTVNVENASETRNTLKFLSAAKEIKLSSLEEKEKRIEFFLAQIKYLSSENRFLHKAIAELQEKSNKHVLYKEIDEAIRETEKSLEKVGALQKKVEDIEKNFFSIKKHSHAVQSSLFRALCEERRKEIENIDQLPSPR